MSYITCPVVRVKASHPSQGAFVEINASDYDPKVHELVAVVPAPPPPLPLPPPPPGPVDPLAGLPKHWREFTVAKLRVLAEAVAGRTPDDKKQAIELIEAALLARK